MQRGQVPVDMPDSVCHLTLVDASQICQTVSVILTFVDASQICQTVSVILTFVDASQICQTVSGILTLAVR